LVQQVAEEGGASAEEGGRRELGLANVFINKEERV
jgi:hypothetical protein